MVWSKVKWGVSRVEKKHVQALILEREKACLQEVRCRSYIHMRTS
jgi:hypothetical protein